MALNWDISNIENYKKRCYLPDGTDPDTGKPLYKLNPVTYALIHMTVVVALPGIAEDNAEEFYFRTAITEKLLGASLRDTINGEVVDRFITPEDVISHIGLKANVGRESIAQFRKRIVDGSRWRLARDFEAALKERTLAEKIAHDDSEEAA